MKSHEINYLELNSHFSREDLMAWAAEDIERNLVGRQLMLLDPYVKTHLFPVVIIQRREEGFALRVLPEKKYSPVTLDEAYACLIQERTQLQARYRVTA